MSRQAVTPEVVPNILKSPQIRRYVEPPSNQWQAAWMHLSEYANPIVVKEARQSLSSRQFSISFSLTLLAVVF